MNEIEAIKKVHAIPDGSTPIQITPSQQRGANIAGRLLVHAHRKGKRLKGRWL